MYEPIWMENIWFAMIAWGLIYLSDYYLTIFNAKRYRENLSRFIQHEGSFELTPQFQEDIDNLRLFSPRFISRWVISLLAVYGIWWASFRFIDWPEYYFFFVGALILREIAIHKRHFQMLFVSQFSKKGGISGSVHYSRWFSLKLAASEMLYWGCLFLVLGLLYRSWFFYGGVFGCWVVAFKKWRLGAKAFKNTPTTSDNQ
jgi:hypothetical protein